ncbi:hypothetical protein B0H10DRAFT_1231828 [Mycena sp. CBHHK59/15]|nr:hypothetical protein B0H10DRAFT_1231828 [Mycena sp. CBHHK59/15]
MDGQPPSHDTWTPKSTPNESDGTPAQYVGGFFPNSQQFAISGGAFTSVTNYVTPTTAPSDFRSIPLGDLDLRLEILQNKYGVVNLRRGGNTARRLYSARIHGLPSDMSVAVYQGHNAEEDWRREIERYSGIRHPNFVQLFGVVNTCRMYAAIFHDDLIPLDEISRGDSTSPLSEACALSYAVHPSLYFRQRCSPLTDH